MIIQVNDRSIKLKNSEVKVAKNIVTTFLKNAQEHCAKIGAFSLYFTVLIIAHTITADLINTYDPDKLKKILDALNSEKE